MKKSTLFKKRLVKASNKDISCKQELGNKFRFLCMSHISGLNPKILRLLPVVKKTEVKPWDDTEEEFVSSEEEQSSDRSESPISEIQPKKDQRKARKRFRSSSVEKRQPVKRAIRKTSESVESLRLGKKTRKKRSMSRASSHKEETKEDREKELAKEKKRKERELKKILYSVNPNPKIEKITVNPLLESVSKATKIPKFPLEGVGKYTDNLKFIYLYSQNTPAAKREFLKMLKDHSKFSDPFKTYSHENSLDIIELAIKRNDIEALKVIVKEMKGLRDEKFKR